LKNVFLHKFKKQQPTTKKRQPTTMLSAQRTVAKKKGAKRTSFGRSLEVTANSLQAARALGDITNLIDETLIAYEIGNRRKGKACMELVNKALPIVQRVISENILKTKVLGAGANYSVSHISSEEKKRLTRTVQHMMTPTRSQGPNSDKKNGKLAKATLETEQV
jgi:hypothetical protein